MACRPKLTDKLGTVRVYLSQHIVQRLLCSIQTTFPYATHPIKFDHVDLIAHAIKGKVEELNEILQGANSDLL